MTEEFSLMTHHFLAIVIIVILFIYFKKHNKTISIQPSYYEIYIKDTLNNPDSYPLNQTISEELYQPIDLWIGRLILPQIDQIRKDGSVLFEVLHAAPDFQKLHFVQLDYSPILRGLQQTSGSLLHGPLP